MCGLSGYIGESTDPDLTYELITSLFGNLDIRGLDASGVWATESGENGSVFYHKEPLHARRFIQTTFWQRLANHNINLMLVHARGASKGMGDPKLNKNNHPFASQDYRLALIHNGVIYEANDLKQHYETLSECDSEVLLRIYEAEALKRNCWLDGVKEIWSLISQGHMAVAIGERDGANRTLSLFRNEKRPLWIADLRKYIGQIFFFSCPIIWEETLEEFSLTHLAQEYPPIELASQEAWYFELSDSLEYWEYPIITQSKIISDLENVVAIAPPQETLDVISDLDAYDELLY